MPEPRRATPVTIDFQPGVLFDFDFKDQIRRAVGSHQASRPLRITKRHLEQVCLCERSWLTQLDSPFPGWSPRLAAGSVIHEAIRLHLGTRPKVLPPEQLFEGVLHRLLLGRGSLGRWLAEADPLDLAELRLQTVDTIARFQADFPELDPALTVRADSKIEVPLGNNVILVSKPDLVLGTPTRTPQGMLARAVGVEFKTGSTWAGTAAQQLNLHSICETLRFGAPLANHYGWNLTSGQVVGQPVDPDVLLAHAEGFGRIIQRMTALLEERAAELRPGWWCQWCPNRPDCPAASQEDGWG